jgi:S-formylglutathione hydrolase
VPDAADNWKLGWGAGFYVDATQAPWSIHYQMYSYIHAELPRVIETHFPVDMSRQSIFGHSMGGHGAIIMALRNPGRYRSCSAFAPIVHPITADWSRPALRAYLGNDERRWRQYDSVALIEDGARLPELLVDQGTADQFLTDGLRPQLLQGACDKAGIPLTLRLQEGYDHSYFFICTFMSDHIAWHAKRLFAQER